MHKGLNVKCGVVWTRQNKYKYIVIKSGKVYVAGGPLEAEYIAENWQQRRAVAPIPPQERTTIMKVVLHKDEIKYLIDLINYDLLNTEQIQELREKGQEIKEYLEGILEY